MSGELGCPADSTQNVCAALGRHHWARQEQKQAIPPVCRPVCLPALTGRAKRAWEQRRGGIPAACRPLRPSGLPACLPACPTGRTERAWEERKRRDSGRLSCLPRFGCRLGVWPTWSFPDGILADPCKQGNSACMRVKMGLDSPHRSPGLYYRGRCCAVSRSNGQKSQKCDSRSIVARKQRVSMLKRLGIRVG